MCKKVTLVQKNSVILNSANSASGTKTDINIYT